ncbi:hypothetical protein ECMP0210179_1508 [Escherichia coli MP021017.9]|nr:hypothetical protein ECMP0210179_1508 [Escherichia coli MP021017.9]EMU97542.1 hypothetical protein ECMP0210173_1568 [Escherichia coli MP021017.3]EMV00834.1 hypothetical protein ECMP0210172_1549 [Escherichia coli MP021017.2]EMV07915.1 hypothetical protein ECMP02101710_1548 [Escherichia coli MP021017.10]EMV86808.1 hypothetical protein EC2861200_1503 [Escherichia coli 2861200]EMX42937.1 hypothetical protein ECMP0210171_1578 [Escherichia coli MP021017.1]
MFYIKFYTRPFHHSQYFVQHLTDNVCSTYYHCREQQKLPFHHLMTDMKKLNIHQP